MLIDAHHHFWSVHKLDYGWLKPELGAPLYADYRPRDLAPLLAAAGVTATVLVQAADNAEDTAAMLSQAEDHDWIAGVVGWVPLTDPDEARRRLTRYARHPKFKGVRHLIHDDPDPDWLLRAPVMDGLRLLAEFGLTFDLVAVYPRHLHLVPGLAREVPALTFVIDHLAKPPIAAGGLDGWADELAAAAGCPNVVAKISGLNTAAAPAWRPADLKPALDHALDCFGAERILWGSDWPVCLVQGDYVGVLAATRACLRDRSQAELDAIFGGTARRVYRL